MLRLSEPCPPPETGYRPIDGEPTHLAIEDAVARARELVIDRPGRAVILIEVVDDDDAGNVAGVDAWTVAYEPGVIRNVADGPDGELIVDRAPATITVVHDGRAQQVTEHDDGGVRTVEVGGLAGPHRADIETLEEATDADA